MQLLQLSDKAPHCRARAPWPSPCCKDSTSVLDPTKLKYCQVNTGSATCTRTGTILLRTVVRLLATSQHSQQLLLILNRRATQSLHITCSTHKPQCCLVSVQKGARSKQQPTRFKNYGLPRLGDTPNPMQYSKTDSHANLMQFKDVSEPKMPEDWSNPLKYYPVKSNRIHLIQCDIPQIQSDPINIAFWLGHCLLRNSELDPRIELITSSFTKELSTVRSTMVWIPFVWIT